MEEVGLGTTQVEGVTLRVAKTKWNGGWIFVDAYRADSGECLTSESLDAEPTLAELRDLLANRVTDGGIPA